MMSYYLNVTGFLSLSKTWKTNLLYRFCSTHLKQIVQTSNFVLRCLVFFLKNCNSVPFGTLLPLPFLKRDEIRRLRFVCFCNVPIIEEELRGTLLKTFFMGVWCCQTIERLIALTNLTSCFCTSIHQLKCK